MCFSHCSTPIRFFTLLAIILVLPMSMSLAWEVDGDPICALENDQETPQVISDGDGGAIMVWGDRRPYPDIYAQRVGPDGAPIWAVDGVSVCSATNAQYTPRIAPDGEGGALIAWRDGRAGNADIYAQRIDAAGTVLWTADGVGVCAAAGTQDEPWITSDGSGGGIVTWRDQRGGLADIYAQRIDASGTPMWMLDGVAVCAASGIQQETSITRADGGGAIVVWEDYRSGGDIYAQRLLANGSTMWAADGVPVCAAAGIQYTPRIIEDGLNGAIVTWQDHRTWYDIYAQRLDGNGDSLWDLNGVVVCAADEWQGYPAIVESGVAGALIAWQDNRSGAFDIYVQQVDSLGAPQWTADGVAAASNPAAKTDVTLCTDGAKGGVLGWQDSRSGTGIDVFAARIDSLGARVWSIEGETICLADGSQLDPKIATDGEGGGFLVWEDNRGSDSDIYAQRILGSGDVVPTLLTHYAISTTRSSIVVRWVLSTLEAETRFRVYRASGTTGAFSERLDVRVHRDGLAFQFDDLTGVPGREYRYRIAYTDFGGSATLFETRTIAAPVARLALVNNHPNPFNPRTTITYHVPEDGLVKLTLHDSAGRAVVELVDEWRISGVHAVDWDGRDRQGRPVASGVYTCRLQADGGNTVLKVTLLR